jgi:hypothetical protein
MEINPNCQNVKHERCDCHDCTQARWLMSFKSQLYPQLYERRADTQETRR